MRCEQGLSLMHPADFRDGKAVGQTTCFTFHKRLCVHKLTATLFSSAEVLLLAKLPRPFCALLGGLSSSVSAFIASTIVSRLKRGLPRLDSVFYPLARQQRLACTTAKMWGSQSLKPSSQCRPMVEAAVAFGPSVPILGVIGCCRR